MKTLKGLTLAAALIFSATAQAHFDTIPSGFRLKYSDFSANLNDGTSSPLAEQTYSAITNSNCLPTDLQMISIGLYDYRYETKWAGNVRGTVQFKKRICAAEGRTAMVQFGILTTNPNLKVRLVSPSGAETPLKIEKWGSKGNQYRITKDFSKIGSTVGDYGKTSDVRAEAGEWVLELSSESTSKIESLSWNTHSFFWLLFPN